MFSKGTSKIHILGYYISAKSFKKLINELEEIKAYTACNRVPNR